MINTIQQLTPEAAKLIPDLDTLGRFYYRQSVTAETGRSLPQKIMFRIARRTRVYAGDSHSYKPFDIREVINTSRILLKMSFWQHCLLKKVPEVRKNPWIYFLYNCEKDISKRF